MIRRSTRASRRRLLATRMRLSASVLNCAHACSIRHWRTCGGTLATWKTFTDPAGEDGVSAAATDTIVTNGNLITLDDRQPRASGMLLRGDRIVAVGSD